MEIFKNVLTSLGTQQAVVCGFVQMSDYV